MKKLLLITLLILIIPYFVVSVFIKNDEMKFYYVSNDTIRVKDEKTGKISTVLFEEYIKGVLSGEMGANFELEALKAQAVAARSYALYKMEKTKNDDYDVVNTVTNQVYLTDEDLKEKWKDKYSERINKIKSAVVETKGEYMTYDNQLVEALFFSTSTGATENSEEVFSSKVPYLRSVSSDDSLSPVYTDSVIVSKEDFFKKLELEQSNNLDIKYLEKTSTGRIKKLTINGKEFTGRDVASKLKLRSNYFEIKKENENIIINTKGYGHGVGMSQYGALSMAKKGYKYDQILKHYYTGVEIQKK